MFYLVYILIFFSYLVDYVFFQGQSYYLAFTNQIQQITIQLQATLLKNSQWSTREAKS